MSGASRGALAAAIAAREAEILGKPQRIAPLPLDEVSAEAWDALNAFRGLMGLGPAKDLPGFSRTLLKHPEIFKRRLELGATFFGGTLPARERELAILRIGWLTRAPFEWGEHVDIARRCGVGGEEIERVIVGSVADGWSAHEAAILSAVEEMLANQTVSDETWAVLAQSWSEQQLIEFPMLVGHYIGAAIMQNVLRIRLEDGNTGLTRR